MIFRKPALDGHYSHQVVEAHGREPQCSVLRAVSSNLLWDERVSEERGRSFIRWVDDLQLKSPALTFRESLQQYCDSQKNEPVPEYLDRVNTNNFRPVKPAGSVVNVLNLSVLFELLNKGIGRLKSIPPVLAGFPRGRRKEYPRWLDDVLDKRHSSRPDALSGIILLINEANRGGPRRPIWVAIHSEFAPLVMQSPDRWLAALGMKIAVNHWIVLISYPTLSVPDLIRPTVLECGDDGFHAPSPNSYDCGFACSLDASVATPLLSEFIHRPVALDAQCIRIKDAAGKLHVRCEQVTATPIPSDPLSFTPWLYEVRKFHRQRLGPGVDPNWLPESEL